MAKSILFSSVTLFFIIPFAGASNAVNGHVLYVDGGILAYIGKQPK